jgi:hypothetical protein
VGPSGHPVCDCSRHWPVTADQPNCAAGVLQGLVCRGSLAEAAMQPSIKIVSANARLFAQANHDVMNESRLAVSSNRPDNEPLFQGVRLDVAGNDFSLSCIIILLVCENDQHGLNSTAPALRSASAYGGWTCRARHSSARQFVTHSGHHAPLDASFPLDDDYTLVAEVELRPHGHCGLGCGLLACDR